MKFLNLRWAILAHILIILGVLSFKTASATQDLTGVNGKDLIGAPIHLKVGEGVVNPIGYYDQRPRFSWQFSQLTPIVLQTAYQIQVSSSDDFSTKYIIWDSAKVVSSKNAWVKYGGVKLSSRQKVYWRVKIWDENDKSSYWSEVNYLEMGLVDTDDWQASWIGHPYNGERDVDTIHFATVKGGKFPAPNNVYYRPQYLRTTFNVHQTLEKARLYITSKGVFKPFINGKAVSKDVMTPGWTPYHKRIETLSYDVTSQIKQGQNALAAIVAEGWHSGRIFHPTKQHHMLPMRLIAQLELTYSDGSREIVSTNEKWHSTIDGPIREASNYDGEIYDANFEMEGWNTAQFTPENWSSVVVEPIDKQVKLAPKKHTAVRSKLILPALKIVSQKNGVTIFDMGQNMVGVPEINIPVIQGQQVRLRFSEALDNGEFAVQNLRSAKNEDLYQPKETGIINYQPTFTFHGFRFVELSGYDSTKQPSLNWLKGHVLHSDFEVYSNFISSSSHLNQLSNNVAWGLRGNFLDIPTDCPQRDERLGWTGDAQVFVGASMYKADVYGFWSAWLESMREEQGIDGLIPNYVPFRSFLASLTGAAWGDAATIVPWALYQHTGDETVIADNYNMMKQWLSYHSFNSYQLVSNMGSHGDWLQPFTADGSNGGETDKDLIATAYFARSAYIVAQSAKLLGYQDDAKQYTQLFNNIRAKFQQYFFDDDLNLRKQITKPPVYKNGSERKDAEIRLFSPKTTQTSYLLPLAFDLFAPKDRANAAAKLVALINDSDQHLRTGFIGTPLLAPVLQKFGYSDLMYEILFKETYPSWFYSINNGATTTWERWDSYSLEKGFNGEKMNSLNHYAYGAVAEWFYRGILGIEQSVPGFKTFTVTPQFNKKLGFVRGSHPTPQGNIIISWAIDNRNVTMTLEVPSNSQASLILPLISSIQVSKNGIPIGNYSAPLPAGTYEITGQLEQNM